MYFGRIYSFDITQRFFWKLKMMNNTLVEAMDVEKKTIHHQKEEMIEREDLEELQKAAEVHRRLQPWKKQITVRGVIVSVFIGSIYSIITMKLALTAGINPHLNVSAALLAFIIVRTWTKLVRKVGLVSVPFTPQENTMIQTCAVACYSIALGG